MLYYFSKPINSHYFEEKTFYKQLFWQAADRLLYMIIFHFISYVSSKYDSLISYSHNVSRILLIYKISIVFLFNDHLKTIQILNNLKIFEYFLHSSKTASPRPS